MRFQRWAVAVFLSVATAPAQPVAPKDAQQAFDRAGIEVKSGRFDDALRDYRQAVSLFPAYAEAWYEMGKLLFEHNQPDTARRALEASIRADPKYAAPYLVLAAIENTQRRWPQLIEVTDRLLQFDSIDYPFAWLLNAVGYYNSHNLAAAEKSARKLETRLTPGEKETRAWTIVKGTKAPQAAAVIHNDFERGFIACETIAYDDFVALKGEQGAKEAGKMRVEGKEYVVKDGDVLLFRFNV